MIHVSENGFVHLRHNYEMLQGILVAPRLTLPQAVCQAFAFVAAFLFGPMTSFAQSDVATEPSVASAARPKVDFVETVPVNGAGYDLLVYLQESKTMSSKDAHVYYTPLFYVVTTAEKELKYGIDAENILSLKVRRDPDSEKLEEEVRKRLIRSAKQIDRNFHLEPGTVPYRIDPLNMSEIVFSSDKQRTSSSGRKDYFVSAPVDMAATEIGEINVNFYLETRADAESFVEALEADDDQLILRYTFPGVSDETCTARFNGSRTQRIDLFKKVTGPGGRGHVARHQAVDIADEMATLGQITARCADYATAQELISQLLGELDRLETVEVADWSRVDKLIAFDEDSFKADVETSVKELKKEVNRKQILTALSEASSNAASNVREGGGSLGYSLFHLKLSGSMADTESESRAGARKDYQDILAKMGLSVEWTGKRYIPKTIDVHSSAKMQSAWGNTFEIQLNLTAGEFGRGKIRITQDAWDNAIPPELQRNFEYRIAGVEKGIEELQASSARDVRTLQGSLDLAHHAAVVAQDLAQLAKKTADSAVSNSRTARSIASNASRISKDAIDRAYVAKRRIDSSILVDYCRYKFDVPPATPNYYYYDFDRSDQVAILSGFDVDCGDNEFDVILARKSRSDANWIVKVDHLECSWIAMDVVFLNGDRVTTTEFWNSTMRDYNYTPLHRQGKWCYSAK